MRSLEALLLLTSLATFLALAVPSLRTARAIINAYSLAFFDRHLKGATAQPPLNVPARQFPDVRFEANQP